jgi:outer membrane immunogenic protein
MPKVFTASVGLSLASHAAVKIPDLRIRLRSKRIQGTREETVFAKNCVALNRTPPRMVWLYRLTLFDRISTRSKHFIDSGTITLMMTVIKVAATVAALGVCASAAHAQNAGGSIWNGAYIGAHAGGVFGKFSDGIDPLTVSGVAGGLHAGYNWQAGSLVYGIEGDADLSGAKKNLSFRDGVKGKVSNDFLGSLRARIGYSSGPALFYGTGGVAFGSAKIEISGLGQSVSRSDTRTGYVLGLGMDYAISSNISARIEGLHYGFKDVFKDDGPVDLKYDANVVRGGISYKF